MDGVLLTVFGFSVIFIATTAGAALVFFVKKEISEKASVLFLGFAAGIMLAASVWSLLIPSIESAADYGRLNFLPAAFGLVAGGLFLVVTDRLVPRLDLGFQSSDTELSYKSAKMFIAITVHNIPEGLAVGFAFGAAAVVGTAEAFAMATGLAVGIAIQNFPEGAAVSLPLKRVTESRVKAFLYGSLSGVVEPFAAVIGYYLASTLVPAQPWFLSFAAGAMIFVVAEDLIPDAKYSKSPHLGTWGVIAGFTVMMTLDVLLG